MFKIISKIIKNTEFEFEEEIYKRNGDYLCVAVNSKILNYASERIILSFIRDITQQKKEKKLIDKMRQENEQFLRHEIQNTIVPIKNFTELLFLEKKLTEEQSKYIKKINECVTSSLNFLNHFKNIHDIENGIYNLDLTEQSLNEIIENIIINFKHLKPSVCLEFIQPPKPLFSKIDRYLMEHVLLNLIKNSIEHIQNCRIKTDRNIRITLMQDAGNNIIKINNKGNIIPPHMLKVFFEKFITTKNSLNGSGLGTSFSKVVVNAHGGTISVKSNSTEGTTVTIILMGASINNNLNYII